MFAALDLWDFFWIWAIVSLGVGGIAVTTARLEAKVDMLLRHSGLTYQQPAEQPLTPGRKRGVIVGIIAIAVLVGYILFDWLRK